MNYADWIEGIEPRCTGKGAALDLRLYVYPDGHGNIVLLHADDNSNQPVNDLGEAMQIFEDLWKKASSARDVDEDENRTQLAAMLQKITPENVHREVPDGGPVGKEVF